MQLNPVYYVEFSDIYPLRRSAAFKNTEFRHRKSLKKRSEAGNKFCSKAPKKILKEIKSILII